MDDVCTYFGNCESNQSSVGGYCNNTIDLMVSSVATNQRGTTSSKENRSRCLLGSYSVTEQFCDGGADECRCDLSNIDVTSCC